MYEADYEYAAHSMWPVVADAEKSRVVFGGADCKQPYSASLLNVSGMSYGALSENAVLALSSAAKMGRFYHNTGEGGMSRFHLEGGGDLVWNIGTGYFGCGSGTTKRIFDEAQFRDNASRPNCKMIELKLSQGAKPAHGGMLPRAKISPAIAEARGLKYPPEGDCNSPARHSAFDSPEGMMRFIARLRELSGGKPVGFKLCLGKPEEFAALVRAMLSTGITPDFVTVDGGEGGTGAAPPEFSNSVGMPLAEGLTLVHAILTGAGLRDRVRVIAAGKVLTGFCKYTLKHRRPTQPRLTPETTSWTNGVFCPLPPQRSCVRSPWAPTFATRRAQCFSPSDASRRRSATPTRAQRVSRRRTRASWPGFTCRPRPSAPSSITKRPCTLRWRSRARWATRTPP